MRDRLRHMPCSTFRQRPLVQYMFVVPLFRLEGCIKGFSETDKLASKASLILDIPVEFDHATLPAYVVV
jgi:hypothetical protein